MHPTKFFSPLVVLLVVIIHMIGLTDSCSSTATISKSGEAQKSLQQNQTNQLQLTFKEKMIEKRRKK
jgi:hypothetical protein